MSGTASSLPSFATSPSTCGVINLLQNGNIFNSTLTTSINTLLTDLGTFSSDLSNLPDSILDQLSGFDQTTLISNLQTEVNTKLPALTTHVNGLIANMITDLGIATSALSAHLGLMNSGCSLPTLAASGATPSNPYPAMQVFFGSVTGNGASMVSAMDAAALNGATATQALYNASSGQIQGIADSIIAYVTTITTIGTDISTMISSENAAFTSVNTDMLNFASANSLLSLYNNPCAAMVIDAVASEALLSFLNSQSD